MNFLAPTSRNIVGIFFLLLNFTDFNCYSQVHNWTLLISVNINVLLILIACFRGIPKKWDPGPTTHRTWDWGTFTWDLEPGTLHLRTFLKRSHLYISYMSYERLHEEEQFRSKKYLLKMTLSRAKLRLKSASQKRNFETGKAIWKSYTLDCRHKCPCTFSA